jgi:perosamine synthetase
MIRVSEPLVGETEALYVNECLRTGWVSSSGKFIEEFEEKWAGYCGMKYGVAVSNGTAALQTALGCLDLKAGDEVIMPAFTIISCALAILYNGAKPVLVDSEPRTWTIDTARIEEKITKKTRAIMAVHIYGHPCDMKPMRELAKAYKLEVIEDAAEAHGAQYRFDSSGDKWDMCGGLGDISCFSFYANKIITTGEGGMMLTSDRARAGKARSIRNLCFRAERRFFHTELGNNFRFTNIQAAIGLAQAERIGELVERKRNMGKRYSSRLKNISVLQLPIEEPWAKNVYWMYGIILDEHAGFDASIFGQKLAEKGIETRPFFLGMHEQPAFHKLSLFKGERYPVTERLARQGLYLPSGLTLTERQQDEVCGAIEDLIGARIKV